MDKQIMIIIATFLYGLFMIGFLTVIYQSIRRPLSVTVEYLYNTMLVVERQQELLDILSAEIDELKGLE